MRLLFLISNLFLYVFCQAQQKVSFYSSDSLRITADLYLKDYKLPFILLFHQEGGSRGEYTEIAKRLEKLDYNCLAVDLRIGDKMNYVQNETVLRAQTAGMHPVFLDTHKDIEASIKYVEKFNHDPVILFGSSFTASLCLMEAKHNPKVNAAIAFSPGEYFRPAKVVKDQIQGLKKPIFVATTELEYEYVLQMLSGIDDQYKTIYHPAKGKKGVHGAKALWNSSESSSECWLDLMLFFKRLRN